MIWLAAHVSPRTARERVTDDTLLAQYHVRPPKTESFHFETCKKHIATMSVVQNICRAMERIAPLRLAEKWDNVGFIFAVVRVVFSPWLFGPQVGLLLGT